MSYVKDLNCIKRRPSVHHVSPEEAIITANEVVDKANSQIAKALAHAGTWQQVATELYEENERLRTRIVELEKELKRATPKAGKKPKRVLSGDEGRERVEEWQ